MVKICKLYVYIILNKNDEILSTEKKRCSNYCCKLFLFYTKKWISLKQSSFKHIIKILVLYLIFVWIKKEYFFFVKLNNIHF